MRPVLARVDGTWLAGTARAVRVLVSDARARLPGAAGLAVAPR